MLRIRCDGLAVDSANRRARVTQRDGGREELAGVEGRLRWRDRDFEVGVVEVERRRRGAAEHRSAERGLFGCGSVRLWFVCTRCQDKNRCEIVGS